MFHFGPISFEWLAEEGWRLRSETLERQGRSRAETREWWNRLCRSAIGLPGFEAWAAMTVDGNLSAALIAFRCEDCCSILYQQSLSSYLANGVNNALTYSYTREVMNRPEVKSIFYGLHSLDAPASVDLFKLRMGYSASPVRQCVLIHPWISPLFNRASLSAIRQARRLTPGNPVFSKAEGMLRFYIDGKAQSDPISPGLSR